MFVTLWEKNWERMHLLLPVVQNPLWHMPTKVSKFLPKAVVLFQFVTCMSEITNIIAQNNYIEYQNAIRSLMIADPGAKKFPSEAIMVKPLEDSFKQTLNKHGIKFCKASSVIYSACVKNLNESMNENMLIKTDEGLTLFEDIKSSQHLKALLLSAKNGNALLSTFDIQFKREKTA